jgi:predicted amidohydrolase YtcJ
MPSSDSDASRLGLQIAGNPIGSGIRLIFKLLFMCDWIFCNARVITMDPVRPEAELIAVTGNRITAFGPNDAVEKLRSPETRIVDCHGATLLPGFIDAHCHLHAYAEALVSLNLAPRANIHSILDIQDRLREFAVSRQPGTWIRAKGYNEFYIAEKRHPNRWDLDAAAPQHPVKLTHRSGHAHVLNSLALERVGITAETGDPPDGLIDRDLVTGQPTGILYGMGAYLSTHVPGMDDAEIERGVALADRNLLSFGITSIEDASSVNGLLHWQRVKSWKNRGLFHPRVRMMMGFEGFGESLHPVLQSEPGADLRPGGVKIIVHQVTGSLQPGQEELNEKVFAVHEAGMQTVIHAVEEAEIEAACNAIEYSLNRSPRRDHRHRIEHCSVCPPSLLERIFTLGITVVTQPSFLYFSGDRYLKTVPERQQEHLYCIGSWFEGGLPVGFGSDFPIVEPNPLIGIQAAVTRMSAGGNPISPGQAIPVLDALRMYTLGAAAAGFEEGIKGSITPGKLADLILLDSDPCEMDAANIKDIRVILTMLDGRIAWSDGTLPH